MATLDSLAGDQRAVLQLVLGRGRSYDQIAGLLSIGPDSVRSRALAALDALGPQTQVPETNRRLICDYLLGQLPDSEVATVRELLAGSPSERAWARVVSAEIAPIASDPLPEIPDASAPSVAEASRVVPDAEPIAAVPEPGEPAGRPAVSPLVPDDAPVVEPVAPDAEGAGDSGPRSSRRGGMVVIGLVALIVVALVVVLALRHHAHARPAADASTSTTSTQPAGVTTSDTASTSNTTTSPTSASPAKVVTQINLSPTAAGSKAIAVAEVLQESSQRELAIVGQNIPANTTHSSYAVWLYNSPSSAYRLGFVSPGITTSGKLSAATPLPSDAGSYKELIVTTETAAHPKSPGPILLQGTITGLS
jgi:hypothetical protein